MTIHGRRWFRGHVVWHRHETYSVGAAAIAAFAAPGILWYRCRIRSLLHPPVSG